MIYDVELGGGKTRFAYENLVAIEGDKELGNKFLKMIEKYLSASLEIVEDDHVADFMRESSIKCDPRWKDNKKGRIY